MHTRVDILSVTDTVLTVSESMPPHSVLVNGAFDNCSCESTLLAKGRGLNLFLLKLK